MRVTVAAIVRWSKRRWREMELQATAGEELGKMASPLSWRR
jgi:hypothetical protein